MRVERGGTGLYVFVPVDGPAGWSTATVSAEMALVTPDVTPQPADWHSATWQGTVSGLPGTVEARWLLQPPSYPQDGDYLLKIRLTAGSEQVVLTSGRVTLG